MKQEWSQMMERLSDVSCAAYRKVVREEPRFVPYFRTATPELEVIFIDKFINSILVLLFLLIFTN